MNVKLVHGGGAETYSFGYIPAATEVVLTPSQFEEFEQIFSGCYTVSQTELDSTFTGEASEPIEMPEAPRPRSHHKK